MVNLTQSLGKLDNCLKNSLKVLDDSNVYISLVFILFLYNTCLFNNINTYVSKNNLKDPVNGRIIRPDAALKKLLRVKDGDEVTFFHMQRLLNPHIKPFKQATPATA